MRTKTMSWIAGRETVEALFINSPVTRNRDHLIIYRACKNCNLMIQLGMNINEMIEIGIKTN
jgi:hypothetical protein